MKNRLITFLFLMFTALVCKAQTEYDGLRLTQNNHYGTARTIALGNAVTALGGDIGSVNINPAGSSVAKFSQLVFSLGSFMIEGKSLFAAEANKASGSGSVSNDGMNMFSPNFGFILNMPQKKLFIKNVSMGGLMSYTNNYLDRISASGENDQTSLSAYFGNLSKGIDVNSLIKKGTYNPYFASNNPWNSILAFESGMISNIHGSANEYVGATEQFIKDAENNISKKLFGPLKQNYDYSINGEKKVFLFNTAANILNLIHVGANIGVLNSKYSVNESFSETPNNPDDFKVAFDDGGTPVETNLEKVLYKHNYKIEAEGMLLKLGVIATPFKGLRLGLALQSPVVCKVKHSYKTAAKTTYKNSKFNAHAETPDSEDKYNFTSPISFNLGFAYTLGKYALFSVDYEWCNYGKMRFKSNNNGDGDNPFLDLNRDISRYMGPGAELRIGVETRFFNSYSIRCGYNLADSPERKKDSYTHKYSIGLGYSSKGALFYDLALRFSSFPEYNVAPYEDYNRDASGNITTYSPNIKHNRDGVDFVATIGFRF